MVLLQRLECLLPCGFAGVVDDWKVLFVRNLAASTAQSVGYCFVPGRDVQHQFPDAVCAGEGPPRGFGRINVSQKLEQRWSMPGIALESALHLVLNSLHFTWHSALFSLL